MFQIKEMTQRKWRWKWWNPWNRTLETLKSNFENPKIGPWNPSGCSGIVINSLESHITTTIFHQNIWTETDGLTFITWKYKYRGRRREGGYYKLFIRKSRHYITDVIQISGCLHASISQPNTTTNNCNNREKRKLI